MHAHTHTHNKIYTIKHTIKTEKKKNQVHIVNLMQLLSIGIKIKKLKGQHNTVVSETWEKHVTKSNTFS